MPTTVSSFLNDEIRMRYQEQYVTQGLNRQISYVLPAGIYRGFEIQPTANPLEVEVIGDATTSDSIALYTTEDDFALHLRRNSALAFGAVDLTAYASRTVVLAIFCEYVASPLTSTAAELRIYELDPTDEYTGATEVGELLVLGTITVPAAGVIPSSAISNDRRDLAWQALSKDAVPWTPLIRNGGFELADNAAQYAFAIPHWELSQNANVTIDADSTQPGATGDRPLVIRQDVNVAGTAYARQYVGIDCASDALFYFQLSLRTLLASTSGVGSIRLVFEFLASDGSGGNTVSYSFDTSAVDGAYRVIEGTIPAQATHLDYIEIRANNLQSTGTGAAVLVDDFQVYHQRKGALSRNEDRALRHAVTARVLQFQEPASEVGTDWGDQPQLRYDSSVTPTLYLERIDQDAAQAVPALNLAGRLLNLGASLIGTDGNAELPRVYTPVRPDKWTLIEEYPLNSGISIRKYVIDRFGGAPLGRSIIQTYNAVWDNTALQWDRDQASDNSHALEYQGSGQGLRFWYLASGSYVGAWDHDLTGGWDHTFNIAFPDGRYTSSDGYFDWPAPSTGANPAVGAELSNRLYAKNVPKAFGYIDTNAGTPILSGFGISSVTVTTSYVQLNFSSAFAGANDYAVVATDERPTAATVSGIVQIIWVAEQSTRLAGSIRLYPYQVSVGAFPDTSPSFDLIDPSGSNLFLNFAAFGEQ